MDITDTSRVNIARIRKGEAYRRYDNAYAKGNDYRTAYLRGRVRSAKTQERLMKRVDKGARLAVKGKTVKGYLGYAATYGTGRLLTKYLNSRLSSLGNQGRLTPNHIGVANMINVAGNLSLSAIGIVYAAKQFDDASNIRSYQNAVRYGNYTIKKVGSSEYQDVIKRRSNNH